MKKPQAVSATAKINLVLAVSFMLVLLIGVVALVSTNRQVHTGHDVERAYHVLGLLDAVHARLYAAETAQRGFVLTGDAAYLAPHDEAVRLISGEFAMLHSLLLDDGQRQRVTQLERSAGLRLAHIDSVIALRRDVGAEAATAAVRAGRGRELMEGIREELHALEAAENDILEARQVEAVRAARATRFVVIIGSVFAAVLVLLAAVVLNRDFAQRRRMEHTLRENEALLNQFLESLPAGAFVVSADGRARYANRQARALLGLDLSRGGLSGDMPHRKRTFRAGTDTIYPADQLPLARAIRGETVQTDDMEVEHDGVRVPVRVGAVPIYDSTGDVAYAIAVIADISAEQRQRESLRAARDAAEEASRSKSEFLARMSHELRTPLNSVIGFANILRKNKAGTLVQQDLAYLERISENGKHLLTLINDILDLSKIEAGKIELERAPVDLESVIAETLRQWEPTLKDGALRIVANVPPGLDPIAADRSRLKQVLTNLVGNAIKFTAHGSVTVSVDVVQGTRTPVRIRVTDTGIGIPADRREAVFEAFEQAETTTSRTYGGTGLGLPISRKLCALMDFELLLGDAAGTGSEFCVMLNPGASLPIEHAPAVLAPQPVALSDGCLVLVVDDDEDARILLEHHLEECGCRVVTTHSGHNALQLARELNPDLITVDLLMEDINGWQVISQLKADARVREIPVIVVSVVAQENRAALIGAIDVLNKPVQRDVLVGTVRRNAGRERPHVLIVEDNEDLRRLMGRFLETAEIPSTLAGDGLEALDQLERVVPDLIVLDLGLPVLGGLEFLRRIRTDPRFVGLPVVIVTGGTVRPADLAGLTGATAVVDKGADLQMNLRDAVRHALAAGRNGSD